LGGGIQNTRGESGGRRERGTGRRRRRRRRQRDSGGSFEIGAACLQSEIRYPSFSIIFVVILAKEL
jgi:hypothetical protein